MLTELIKTVYCNLLLYQTNVKMTEHIEPMNYHEPLEGFGMTRIKKICLDKLDLSKSTKKMIKKQQFKVRIKFNQRLVN